MDSRPIAGLTDLMRKGLLEKLRDTRRWFIQAVAIAFMLPALMGLLPQPTISAAAALEHDLMLSVCGQELPRQQGGGQHQQDHDHCVLCGQHCPASNPSLASATPAFDHVPRHAGKAEDAAAAAIAPPLQALLDASPPRGPPALS